MNRNKAFGDIFGHPFTGIFPAGDAPGHRYYSFTAPMVTPEIKYF